MLKFIRDKAPFVMLGYSLAFAIASYFEVYLIWFKYLPDLVGFSVFTSIFMLTVYMNKKYCTTTKLAVWGLILLNIFNLISTFYDISMVVYDIYMAIIILVIIFKIKN